MSYDPRQLSDEELVQRAHAELFHVTRAYEELMRRYQRTLFNVCARYLGNDRDADDVCQEVMLKVLYGLKNFEGKSKFKTWLYSITYNECITQYRKERRKRRLLDALSLDPVEEARTNIEVVQRLRAKAAKLVAHKELQEAISRQDAPVAMRLVQAAMLT